MPVVLLIPVIVNDGLIRSLVTFSIRDGGARSARRIIVLTLAPAPTNIVNAVDALISNLLFH